MGNLELQRELGEAIHRARRRKGLSQAALAERLKVSEDTIGDWENGRGPQAWEVLVTMARELDFSLDRVVMGPEVYAERIAEQAAAILEQRHPGLFGRPEDPAPRGSGHRR